MIEQHLDVLIVGAGISGIGTAYHLQEQCPDKSYAIVERRQNLGGTWDLFRYPGIRSDSDMYTFGFSFRPWKNPKAVADGPDILAYLKDTAAEYGIDKKIQYGINVKHASWSTADARWTIYAEREDTGEEVRITCNFLFMCAGYYNYDAGYTPRFEGVERFGGPVVHPQHWTEDIDYKDKRVVVIGSGATAVTLVPSLAKEAQHVTMLQRSPTYIASRPDVDFIADKLQELLPEKLAYKATRLKNVLYAMFIYGVSRRRPEYIKSEIKRQIRSQVGTNIDVDTHFTPKYEPWDQRLCLAPNGDFFRAIRSGSASVVTDEIETFTETGLRLRSGKELPADLVVTATGLQMAFLGSATGKVDGEALNPPEHVVYKGMMVNDVPNLVVSTGYTHASWTLKVDLTSAYACRLINHMDKHGYHYCCPRQNDPDFREESLLDLTSGYVKRAIDLLPKQGTARPWKLHQNYLFDMVALRYGSIKDDAMSFGRRAPRTS